jgi:hypothetical protein
VLVGQQFAQLETASAQIREGQLKIGSGSLSLENGTEILLQFQGPGGVVTRGISTRSLTYDVEDTDLRYESGAVFREIPAERSGSDVSALVASQPQITCRDDHAFLSFVRLTGEVGRSLGGGTAAYRIERETNTLVYPLNRTGSTHTASSATRVTIQVAQSESAGGWDTFLQESNWQPSPVLPGYYRCQDPDGDGDFTVYARLTTINVTFTG